ncbi:NYN domain-containing protein [Helicobacter pylori]|uniref:NYN domain-containing protein n=1 Tax=Helicobacter pylori TaxID=210 RepID=UPI001F089544|nr:NYN domain-containing protein [Helicobacter pylori]
MFKELQNHGEVIIRQSFRDWEQENTKPWDRKLHEKFAIEPIQVFSKTRKNSCDLRIVRAILEAINEKHIDTIALVSSDSDFRDLVIAVKSKGFHIILSVLGSQKRLIGLAILIQLLSILNNKESCKMNKS